METLIWGLGGIAVGIAVGLALAQAAIWWIGRR